MQLRMLGTVSIWRDSIQEPPSKPVITLQELTGIKRVLAKYGVIAFQGSPIDVVSALQERARRNCVAKYGPRIEIGWYPISIMSNTCPYHCPPIVVDQLRKRSAAEKMLDVVFGPTIECGCRGDFHCLVSFWWRRQEWGILFSSPLLGMLHPACLWRKDLGFHPDWRQG